MNSNQFEIIKMVLESIGYLIGTLIAVCAAYLHLVLYYTINRACSKLRASIEEKMEDRYMPRELALATFVHRGGR